MITYDSPKNKKEKRGTRENSCLPAAGDGMMLEGIAPALSFNVFGAHFAGSLTLAKIKNYRPAETIYYVRTVLTYTPASRVDFGGRCGRINDTANNNILL